MGCRMKGLDVRDAGRMHPRSGLCCVGCSLYRRIDVKRIILAVVAAMVGGCSTGQSGGARVEAKGVEAHDGSLRLGNFSMSLVVKDLAASRAFYEKLGFKVIGGVQEQNWLILQNDASTIGLFHGPMYKGNMLTYNPGWDRHCQTLPAFDDVREIQRRLRAQGIEMLAGADEGGSGPASLVLTDPDGNIILVDQHVPAPAK